MVLNANTACRGYCSFLCPRTRASTAVGILPYRYSNVRFCALSCRSLLRSTRTPLVAVVVLFLYPLARASTAVVSRYTAIGMCAFAHFLAARNGTQREHRLSRLLFFFLCPRNRASTAVVSRYTAIGMCAFAHFLAARNCTQREHRLSRLLFFFMSTHSCKHGGGHKKEHSHK